MSSRATPALSSFQAPQASTTASGDGQAAKPSVARFRPKDFAGVLETNYLFNENDWQSWAFWREDMYLRFGICGLVDYVHGQLPCPDKATDPIGASNWEYNDTYTKILIRDCLREGQKYHTANCDTSHQMWKNLEAFYQCGDKLQLTRELRSMKAKDGDNIIDHIAKFTQLWDRIMLVFEDNPPIPPKLFKVVPRHGTILQAESHVTQTSQTMHLSESAMRSIGDVKDVKTVVAKKGSITNLLTTAHIAAATTTRLKIAIILLNQNVSNARSSVMKRTNAASKRGQRSPANKKTSWSPMRLKRLSCRTDRMTSGHQSSFPRGR